MTGPTVPSRFLVSSSISSHRFVELHRNCLFQCPHLRERTERLRSKEICLKPQFSGKISMRTEVFVFPVKFSSLILLDTKILTELSFFQTKAVCHLKRTEIKTMFWPLTFTCPNIKYKKDSKYKVSSCFHKWTQVTYLSTSNISTFRDIGEIVKCQCIIFNPII